MAKQGDNIVFLVEAEEESEPDPIMPGEIYPEASEELIQSFSNGKPFLEGPLVDSYGNWITSFAPILNPDNGEVIAALGVDIDAGQWETSINIYRLFSFVITLLLALIVAVFSFSLSIISRDRDHIRKTNKDLEASLEQVMLLEGIIPICMYCKKIRDDDESWQRLEEYFTAHSEAVFSHGMCPECYEKQLKDFERRKMKN